jgi:uncharacterized Zn finger protein (UPF0148 family)
MSKPACQDCGAVLSRYRKPRETVCAPCERKRIDRSLEHAYTEPARASRTYRAFSLRWRGDDWDSIAEKAEYPTANAAQSAAREYAKKNRLVLP